MAWAQIGNLKGPQGDEGVGVATAVVNGSHHLIVTLTDASTVDAGYVRGAAGADGVDGADGADGADGTSVTIVDNVANSAALPTGLGSGDAGKGWLTDDDGHLHVWSGSAFTDVGTIRGPQGIKGDTGDDGADGADGLSAYELAGGDGTWGTEAAYLSSLHGADGTDGADGSDGTNGVRGATWFAGSGAPTTIVGQLAGDKYLDLVDGNVYVLS